MAVVQQRPDIRHIQKAWDLRGSSLSHGEMQLLKKPTLFKLHECIYSIQTEGGNSSLSGCRTLRKVLKHWENPEASEQDGKEAGSDHLQDHERKQKQLGSQLSRWRTKGAPGSWEVLTGHREGSLGKQPRNAVDEILGSPPSCTGMNCILIST